MPTINMSCAPRPDRHPASRLPLELARWRNGHESDEARQKRQRARRQMKWCSTPTAWSWPGCVTRPRPQRSYLVGRRAAARALRGHHAPRRPKLTHREMAVARPTTRRRPMSLLTMAREVVKPRSCSRPRRRLHPPTRAPPSPTAPWPGSYPRRSSGADHDAERRPINASSRRRHPTPARNASCANATAPASTADPPTSCAYDTTPTTKTRHTITEELELRCAPCHHKRTKRKKQQRGQRMNGQSPEGALRQA